MKLKSNYITQEIDDTQFLIAVGKDAFKGLVRSNKTAAFIVDLLKNDISEEEITDRMCEVYDAPRDVIERDVADILCKLRSIDALEES